MKKCAASIILFVLILLLPASIAKAATVKLSWLPNTEPDLGGYKVHYGTSSGTYTTKIDIGNVTSYTLSNVDFGTYYFTLTAYDINRNESGFALEIPIVISAPNQAPSVSVSANPTLGTAPLSANFSGTGIDNDGTIVSRLWSFGDGSQSTEQNPSHTYIKPGTYTATLTVTDDDGDTGSNSVIISVSAPNQLPTVSLSASSTSGTTPSVSEFFC